MIGGKNMWVCVECGHLFDEADYWEESHGLDYGPYESFSGCPKCGGTYVKARKCDCCEEYITGRYIRTVDDQRICEECYVITDLGDEDE